MPKLKPGTIYPTPEEDAAINAGIMADPDNSEWTAEDFATAKPAGNVLPPQIYAALVTKRPRGRPRSDETKVFTAIRFDADLLEAFRSNGKGWQTRINEALQEQMTITACLDEQGQIYARFQVPDQTTASTIDEALNDILTGLQDQGTIPIYPVIGSYLTVKGRIPLGNNRSFWVFRATRRIRSASQNEINSDRLAILDVLKSRGLICNWVN